MAVRSGGVELSRIAVLTGDVIGARLAGAAIRSWHIALELAADGHEVRLLSTAGADRPGEGFEVAAAAPEDLRVAVRWAEVLVVQGWVLARDRALVDHDRVVVVDLYDPMHLEQLEQGHEAGSATGRWNAVRDVTGVLNEQLLRGDAFLCASERQRAFWLGHLAALGRINPATYDADPTMERFIRIVPFGVPNDPPVRTGPGARGTIEGIGPQDRLLLWGGGIWNWFDPLTLIDAVDRLRARLPAVRLLFLGTTHPNAAIPEMRAATAARARSDELGLTGTHVFFNEGWVPYDQRQNFLLDADLGVSTHLHHVETAFSFRTRLLDCIWAGLPIVATGGDALGDLVEQRNLGLTVAPRDAESLEAAIWQLLTDARLAADVRRNLAAVAEELRWRNVVAPLLELCRDPAPAADRADPAAAPFLQPVLRLPRRGGWRHDLGRLRSLVADGGWQAAVGGARRRLASRRA